MPALVELKNVYAYTGGGRAIFEDVNLSLGPEKVFLAAPLGSGKGLFLSLLAGMERPDKGSVRVFGHDVSALDADALCALRCRLGLVTQDNALISNLKVIENCALPLLYHTEMAHDEAMSKARALLDSTGFTGDPWELPGPLPNYARKQIAIARALALDPEVVVCENLGDGLTSGERTRLFELLLAYQAGSASRLLLVASTERFDAAFVKPDRLLRIEKGRIIEDGVPA